VLVEIIYGMPTPGLGLVNDIVWRLLIFAGFVESCFQIGGAQAVAALALLVPKTRSLRWDLKLSVLA